jgi:CHAD domain-containing protein
MEQREQPLAQQTHSDREVRLQALALALFDGGAEAHRLPDSSRRLLQFAVAFHAIAGQSGTEHTHRTGRDLVLAAPVEDLTAEEQAIVACVVALQRGKIRPQRETAFVRLGKKEQRKALRLAAVLQLADALSAVAMGWMSIETEDETTGLVVGGEDVVSLVAAVDEAGALWRSAIGELEVRAGEPGELGQAPERTLFERQELPAVHSPLPPLTTIEGLSGGEPIAEGARRVLRRFFDRLLAREEAVRKGEDPEDIHQMRVATRRLRASLQVVETIYDPELVRRYRRGLRRVAQSLGAVRDGDVFLQHLAAYRAATPDGTAVEPLVEALEAERAEARARLLHDLDADRYARFKQEFAAFLTTPGAGIAALPETGTPPRVRDEAGSAIWRRYEQWRAYEVALEQPADETLHQARIAGKRMRYTLEFFAAALGPQVEQVLAPLVALQENLGDLQDGVVARAHVAALGLAEDPGAQAYLAARDAERATHLAELPRRWEKVASATYRRRMFELIVKL